VRLDPVSERDAEGLHAVYTDPVVYTQGYLMGRPPAHLAETRALVASAILLRAWVTAVPGAIALYLAFRRRIHHEERLLTAALPGYRRYMSRTGALLPRCGLGPARRVAAARRDRGEASPGSGRPPGGRRLPA